MQQSSLVKQTGRDGELSLTFSGPIVYRTERFQRDNHLALNLYAVHLDDAMIHGLTRFRAPWVDHVTVESILGDSVRINLHLKGGAALNVYGVPPTTNILVTTHRHSESNLNGLATDETAVPPIAGPPGDSGGSDPPAASGVDRIRVQKLNFENGGTVGRLECDLESTVHPRAFLLMTDRARPRLVFDLPSARIDPAEQTIEVPDNPVISRIRTGVFDKTVARVVLDLKEKAHFSVSSGGTHVVLSIAGADVPLSGPGVSPTPERPSIPDTAQGGQAPSLEAGSLSGRTIVIDAGHGGHDHGATGFGLQEKDVALDIARRLHEVLNGAGVHAVLTRSDDRFLPLPSRPEVANQINADAFVAIHLNSTGSATNVWSGTETYYHFQDPIGRTLAESVQNQLVQAIGLPDRGARSDTSIARHIGFSVLRNSQVPAILIEVGYLNHPFDAHHLASAEFRERAAEGIMAGLRSYFGRNLQSARRGG